MFLKNLHIFIDVVQSTQEHNSYWRILASRSFGVAAGLVFQDLGYNRLQMGFRDYVFLGN